MANRKKSDDAAQETRIHKHLLNVDLILVRLEREDPQQLYYFCVPVIEVQNVTEAGEYQI